MRQFLIRTNEYEANVGRLLKRRLLNLKSEAASALIERNFADSEANSEGSGAEICGAESEQCCTINIKVKDKNELIELSSALAELMHFDLRHFEIADMTEMLSSSLEGKQKILRRALKNTEAFPCSDSVVPALCEYLRNNSILNLEGYLRFRMRSDIACWSAAVDAAFAEEIESSLYYELLSALEFLPIFNSIDDKSVTVVLHPDGSCSISSSQNGTAVENERSFRIECAPDSIKGVLSLLSGMEPRCVSVIDLSLGRCEELKRAIEELFLPRQ